MLTLNKHQLTYGGSSFPGIALMVKGLKNKTAICI